MLELLVSLTHLCVLYSYMVMSLESFAIASVFFYVSDFIWMTSSELLNLLHSNQFGLMVLRHDLVWHMKGLFYFHQAKVTCSEGSYDSFYCFFFFLRTADPFATQLNLRYIISHKLECPQL